MNLLSCESSAAVLRFPIRTSQSFPACHDMYSKKVIYMMQYQYEEIQKQEVPFTASTSAPEGNGVTTLLHPHVCEASNW